MQNKITEGFRLSPQQKRLWLLQQNSSIYRAQCGILIQGNLEIEVLKAALQQVINQHEILCTSFRHLSGVKFPVMVVADSNILCWRDINLSDWEPQEQEAEITAIFQEERQQNFDFEEDSLLHSFLITLSPNKHILLISLPSLCADSWTLKNLVAEISKSYSLLLQRETKSQAVVQYLQFSEWQNQLLTDEDAKTANEYWQQQKLSSLATLKLPFEKKLLNKSKFEIDCLKLVISLELTAKIETLANKYKTSINIVLLACWQILIWRLTGQSEIVIGTACDRREYEELQEVLGLLATWIPIKGNLTSDLRFQEVLELTEKTLDEASEWQDYFVPEPVENHNDLAFPIGFEFEELPDKYFAADVTFSLDKYYSCIEPFKVKLTCTQSDNVLNAEFYYDVNYFPIYAIQNLAKHFEALLISAIANPDEKISLFEILSESDRQKLLFEFNNTQIDYSPEKCIHQLFEEQVEKTPNNIAVVFEDQQLTYSELNRRANQLAHYLQQQGVKPEVIVGLCVERSLEMIIALLGILKAGGAYLAIDPALPQEAISFRLQDAQVSLVVSHSSLAHNFEQTTVICLDTDWQTIAQYNDDNPTSEVASENLVYVIFTSGSTGRPKGVAIEHQQLLNYLYGIIDRLNLATVTNFASVSTLAADLGNTVIFPALCTGGTLHVISSERVSDSTALAEYCRRHPIDCLKIVPSHLASLLASAPSASILPRQILILGGETATWDLIEQIQQQAPDCLIFNHYGPTETTIGVTTFPVKNKPARTASPQGALPENENLSSNTQCPMPDFQANYESETVPLGRPLPNTQIYLLDEYLQPVPIGVMGEVYIGGAGLARGYLNRPELTAERFITNPFEINSGQDKKNISAMPVHLYKTGDLARYLPDGNIEFIERVDNQVKIRGFRIELGEIEAVLSQHPQVQQAVVSLREEEPNNKRLVAYIVPSQKQGFSVSDLRKFLKQKLPEYMIPSAFVILKALPLTPNGKVNHQALPEPDSHRPELEATYVAPKNEMEQTIATIWQQILNVDKVGMNDNFFELGGHSLLIVQIHSKLKKVFNRDLSITDLFEYPTISSLVKYLSQEHNGKNSFDQSQNRANSRLDSRKLRTQARRGNS